MASVIIKNEGSWCMQFLLDHSPSKGEEVALKTAASGEVDRYDGVYRLTKVGVPPASLKSAGFHWEVQLERVRKLNEGEQPIPVGCYL